MPRTVTHLIVHCSALEFGSAAGIDRYHRVHRGWSAIGYNYVIESGVLNKAMHEDGRRDHLRDGMIVPGRDLDSDGDVEEETGAHVRGLNNTSLGICLVGTDNFTVPQVLSLIRLLALLRHRHAVPVRSVLGHRETTSGRESKKTCPNFDMAHIRALLDFEPDA